MQDGRCSLILTRKGSLYKSVISLQKHGRFVIQILNELIIQVTSRIHHSILNSKPCSLLKGALLQKMLLTYHIMCCYDSVYKHIVD